MKKKIVTLVVLPFFIAACGNDVAIVPTYKTVQAQYGALPQAEGIIATVEGKHASDLAFKTAGRIKTVNVDVGTRVKAGDVLATLGNEEANITINGLNNAISGINTVQSAANKTLAAGKQARNALADMYTQRLALADTNIQNTQIEVHLAQADMDLAQTLQNMGEMIASGTIANAVESAKQAKANLTLAQTNYNEGLLSLSGTLNGSNQSVTLAQNNVTLAQNQLDNTKATIATERESARKNGISSLASAYTVARSARDFLDQNLSVTAANSNSNSTFDMYLGAKDISTKNTAKDTFTTFNNAYTAMQMWYNANIATQSGASNETVYTGLSDALTVLTQLQTALQAFSTMLNNSVASGNFTDTQLSALKTQTDAFLNNLDAVILTATTSGMAGVKGVLETMDNINAQEKLTVTQLTDALALAQGNLALAQNGYGVSSSDTQKGKESLQTNLTLAQSQYNTAINAFTISKEQANSQLQTLQNNVASKSGALQTAKNNAVSAENNKTMTIAEENEKLNETDATIAEATEKIGQTQAEKAQTLMNRDLAEENVRSGMIIAPFDGIVTEKTGDVGDTVSAGMPIIQLSETGNNVVRIAANNALYNLQVSDTVPMMRLSDQTEFTGSLTVLDTQMDALTGKQRMEIAVPNAILLGDRMRVELQSKPTGQKGVIIPLAAIVTRYDTP